MKSIKRTITSTQLNTGAEIELDVTITDENGKKRTPQEILVVNTSGSVVGALYLDDVAEKALRVANPTWFDFVPFDTGRTSGTLPASIQFITVKQLSGSASGNIDIYLISYF